jgi:hypothetical protein
LGTRIKLLAKDSQKLSLGQTGAGAARCDEWIPAACSPRITGLDALPISSIISPHTADRRRSIQTAVGKEEKKTI